MTTCPILTPGNNSTVIFPNYQVGGGNTYAMEHLSLIRKLHTMMKTTQQHDGKGSAFAARWTPALWLEPFLIASPLVLKHGTRSVCFWSSLPQAFSSMKTRTVPIFPIAPSPTAWAQRHWKNEGWRNASRNERAWLLSAKRGSSREQNPGAVAPGGGGGQKGAPGGASRAGRGGQARPAGGRRRWPPARPGRTGPGPRAAVKTRGPRPKRESLRRRARLAGRSGSYRLQAPLRATRRDPPRTTHGPTPAQGRKAEFSREHTLPPTSHATQLTVSRDLCSGRPKALVRPLEGAERKRTFFLGLEVSVLSPLLNKSG